MRKSIKHSIRSTPISCGQESVGIATQLQLCKEKAVTVTVHQNLYLTYNIPEKIKDHISKLECHLCKRKMNTFVEGCFRVILVSTIFHSRKELYPKPETQYPISLSFSDNYVNNSQQYPMARQSRQLFILYIFYAPMTFSTFWWLPPQKVVRKLVMYSLQISLQKQNI